MGKIRLSALSSGARTWWSPPAATEASPKVSRTAFRTNVDANDPGKDFGSGQSETAIAASGNHVMAAWNDISGSMYLPTTDPQGSVTGVGYSSAGGRTFTDLIGLANNNPFQQWYGDRSVVAVDANTFIVAGLYYPSLAADCTKAPQLLVRPAARWSAVRTDRLLHRGPQPPTTSASDVRISTGQSDWLGVSSLIDPNFGDCTDNASSGNRTYFTWSDGRIGVLQPFVDRR
jgi:hypothetical protein